MKSPNPPDLSEATRLTRQGKLAEATSLIQRLLRGRNSKTSNPSPAKSNGPSGLNGHDAVRRNETRPREGLGKTLSRIADLVKDLTPADEDMRLREPLELPPGASFTTGSYSNMAGMRRYKLYIPAAGEDKPRPLIVMLHGCTQSPDDFALGTRMNVLAEEYGFIVAYPAQHAMANAKRCWNWFKPDDQHRDRGEPSLIAGITQQIIRRHPVDAARVYIAGLSAGGAAAAIMGEAYPELYAAVGVHSGLPCGAANNLTSALDAMRLGAAASGESARPTPTIVFHGDSDHVVHPSNGDAVALRAIGPALGSQTNKSGKAPHGHSYTCSLYKDRNGRVLCEKWTIRGAGHAWAGGNPAGSYADPKGPDASREMVRFFLEHARTD